MDKAPSQPSPTSLPSTKTSKGRDKIHAFTWQWHSIVMATGACSSLAQSFPYHTGSQALNIIALAFFLLDLVIFSILCIWATLRCVMFPEDRASILTDPAKSLFIGFFANGIASLINAALSVNRDWGTGSDTLLYALWGVWWFNCLLSCLIAFGMVYVMMGQNSRDLSKVGPVWMVPVITLITSSSCGGLFARSLLEHKPMLALVTVGISVCMLAIGFSFAMMFTTAFLLRLYLYGPLDATIVLTTFTTLTPLGQGGFSMLINGQNLATLLPMTDPDTQLTGRVVYSVCICAAYLLWSMGVAWIAVACFSIRRRFTSLPRFSVSHWCVIVPNGSFASLSLQLAQVLKSPVFRAFGTVWSCIVVLLWMFMFTRSIPAIIDGSMFKPVSAQQPQTPAATVPASSGETQPAMVADRPSLAHTDRPPSYSTVKKIADIEAFLEGGESSTQIKDSM